MSTRYAAAGSPLRQERYASSEAYKTSLGGLLVAKRCSVLADRELADLIWFIQDQTLADPYALGHRAGSVEALARALLQEANFQPEKWTVISDWSAGGGPDRWEELTPAGIEEACQSKAKKLARALCDLALNPEAVPAEMPGLDRDWRRVLTTHRDKCKQAVKLGLAPTSAAKDVARTLHFARETGKPSLVLARARIGKSAAAKAFCAGSGGLARYVLTPEDSDMVSMYRAFAKALGVADSPSKKPADVRELVERTLVSSKLLLVLDEAQNLFSSALRVSKLPQRVLWLRRLIDAGVPVALVALPEFEQRVERCAKHLGWDSAQITDLICKKTVLPDRLSAADFEMLVARLAVDVSAASKRRIAAAANAQHGAQYVVDVLEVARHSAAKAGRTKPSDQDVLEAIGDRPTFSAVVTRKPGKWPARIAPDDAFSPSSPVPAPGVQSPRREIAPALHEASPG